VKALLRSIDTTSAIGIRDYAMLLLIATYGLRASDVVAVTLDDIRWRQGSLCIHQRKTSSPLELPLTNEVAAAIVKHLKRTPPPEPHRRIFLRMRAPIGLLKPQRFQTFHSMIRKSGLSIPLRGAHCLRLAGRTSSEQGDTSQDDWGHPGASYSGKHVDLFAISNGRPA
jgi:integrase